MPLSIEQVLQQAIDILTPCSDSARLDSEILLAFTLEENRTFLHTWPEQILSESQQQKFNTFIQRRKAGEPVAYIIGTQEFWSLNLKVSPDTLIPRPETELLVEQALQRIPKDSNWIILDAGTGSGAIALAIASERPACQLIATDISLANLCLAQSNAIANKISNITFIAANWLKPFIADFQFNMVVSNPPYIVENDPHLQQGDLRFEPQRALTAGKNGLDDIKIIIQQTYTHLKPGGWLLIEHGYHQADDVMKIMKQQAYVSITYLRDYGGQPRLSLAQKLPQ